MYCSSLLRWSARLNAAFDLAETLLKHVKTFLASYRKFSHVFDLAKHSKTFLASHQLPQPLPFFLLPMCSCRGQLKSYSELQVNFGSARKQQNLLRHPDTSSQCSDDEEDFWRIGNNNLFLLLHSECKGKHWKAFDKFKFKEQSSSNSWKVVFQSLTNSRFSDQDTNLVSI